MGARPRSQRSVASALALALVVTLLPFLDAPPARAADFVVTSLDDSGEGTLRQVLGAALLSGGPHTVTFDVTGVIRLLSPLTVPPVTRVLAADGSGSPTITLEPDVESSNSSVGVILSNDAIIDGLEIVGFGDGVDIAGSGAVIQHSVIRDNATNGVVVDSESGASLIANSRITDNLDGGIRVISGTVEVVQSTLDGNTAVQGGGIFVGPDGGADIDSSTISRNTALGALGESGIDQSQLTGGTGSFCPPGFGGGLFQGFVPDEPALTSVSLWLASGSEFDENGLEAVRIWTVGNAGPVPVSVIGEASRVVGPVAGLGSGGTEVSFTFDPAIRVVPGVTYALEWRDSDGGDLMWIGTTTEDAYPAAPTWNTCGGDVVGPTMGQDRRFSTSGAAYVTSGDGGGIYNEGTVNAINSTISSNFATGLGGGIHHPGASMLLDYLTVASNTSVGGGAGISAPLLEGETEGTGWISNSIVAANVPRSEVSSDVGTNCAGTWQSNGYNLFSHVQSICDFQGGDSSDILGEAAGIGNLADNGGPTQTHAVSVSSEWAFDQADPNNCPSTDQRGVTRPQGTQCDRGAFELEVDGPATPVAVDDLVTAALGTEVLIDLFANDEGDDLSVQGITSIEPIHTGSNLDCDLSTGFCSVRIDEIGSFGFAYTVENSAGSDIGNVTIEVREAFGAEGSAVIDGVLEESWADADGFDFRIEGIADSEPRERIGTVRLMNDGSDLYASIEILPSAVASGFDAGEVSLEFWLGETRYDWSADPLSEEINDFPEGDWAYDPENGVIELRFADAGAPAGTPFNLAMSFNDSAFIHSVDIPNTEDILTWDYFGAVADGDVTSASLAVDSTVQAGFAVGLDDIPSDRLMVGVDRISGAPLGAIGLAESPLGAIPLGAIPLGAIGTATTTVISDVRIDGGWEALLAGTSLEGRPLQTITLADALAALPADRLASLSLGDLDPASSPVGAVTLDTLLLGPNGGPASTPLGAIPLGAIPLGAIPLGAIPLGAIPLGAIGDVQASPLGAIPLGAIGDLAAAPLGAIPLGAIPLGAIPLGAIPLGAIPLGAIPLGAIPLGAIDVGGDFCAFHDAAADLGESCADLGIDADVTTVLQYTELLDVDGEVQSTPLGAIPLGAIPLGAIPLGAIDVSAVPLGAIPLGAIPLGAIPLGAIPLGAIDLGQGLTLQDVCAGQTSCDGDTLLADYVQLFDDPATGEAATLASTPLGAIPLGAIPLGAIPLGAIPLGAIEVAGVPLGAIPLGAIDLRTSPLGAIPLGAIPLGAICLPNSGVQTLGELAAIGGVCPDATLADIANAFPADATLAHVLDHLTIAFLGETEAGFGGLTFGELLVSILLAGDFPWEDLPLDQVETRDVAGQNGLPAPDTVTASVDFTTDGPVDRVQVRIDPGSGFLYVPGSGVGTTSAESAATVVSPASVGGELVFEVLGPFPSGDHTFEAEFFAPLRLGSGAFSASVGSGESVAVAPETPEVVVLPGDAPDSSAGAAPIDADVLYVGHIDAADDEDWFSIQSPPAGDRVAVYLSNIAGDIDLFMYRPETAVVGDADSISSIPLGSIPIEDSGVDHTGDGSLSPEATADYSIDEGQTLAAVSTNRGDEPESVSLFSREAEQYLIQVSSYDTAASDSPYVLRVKYESAVTAPPSECAPRVFPTISGGSLPPLSGAVSSLILHNPSRFNAIGGDGGVADALSDLAAATNGAVVDIAAIPGVPAAFDDWDNDPCSVAAANDVAGAIVTWIQQALASNPTIRDVTIVGSDEVIPFVRLSDTTVVANESTYVDGFDENSALHAAHVTRHYLSDAPYGDLDPVPWLDRYAYVPELGVGRLVEKPTDIIGAIQTFLDANGVLSPETAAVAGYDFLTDGAEAVEDALVANGLTDTVPGLINEMWSATDLLTGAYDPAADVISPNAHYDHYRALPAIENLNDTESDLFTIDDLPADLVNRIVFTMGCHSGLNVPNDTGATSQRDWAEVYGEARAIYIGNTGYGYGDTATVALTERLMANFAASLDGTLTVGQALAQAKQDQFGRAGLYGVYDLKAIEESTLYGLPMWQVGTPGGAAVDDPAVGPVETDPVSGIDAAGFSVSPDFEQRTSPVGTYHAAEGETQFLHWRPIQPKVSVNATQEGKVATGVLLTGLETRDVTVGNAAFARPNTTSGSLREPEVETAGVVFPSTFAQIATSTQLGASGPSQRQFANLIPGQFRGNSAGAGGVQRLFDSVDGLVYYADDPSQVDWTPPQIQRVDASVVGEFAVFEVEATDGQSGVSRVLALYRSSASGGTGSWTAVDLTLLDGVWTGAGPLGDGVSAPLDYMVQAVNGDGAVGVSTFKGEFHRTDLSLIADPSVIEITGVADPIAIGQQVNLDVEIDNPAGLPHDLVFDWGDGTVTDVTTTTTSATGSHTYNAPGVYSVAVTLDNRIGGTDTEVFEYVVVYDPNGGFVTGGGWINSPTGAYLDDPDAIGKATFGFVSRYVRGRTTPDGNAQFQFKTVDLDFRSTSYDWLVIAGARAQFRGVGLLNGEVAPSGEPYEFFIVGIDGALTGGGDTDQFRIKISYSDSGSDVVVYDNKRGATDDSDDATALGGGSIVIHQQQGGGGGRGR